MKTISVNIACSDLFCCSCKWRNSGKVFLGIVEKDCLLFERPLQGYSNPAGAWRCRECLAAETRNYAEVVRRLHYFLYEAAGEDAATTEEIRRLLESEGLDVWT